MSSIQPNAGERGRHSTSPWRMPLAGWTDVAIRTWRESSKDNVGLVAAGVAFYTFLALVPLLGSTVLVYGLVATPKTVLATMQSLMNVMPADVARLIGEQLLNIVNSSSSKKGFGLLLAFAVALFGARNAAGSIITALNIAYEQEEKRGFLKVTALALLITTAAVFLALVGIGVMTALRFLESLIPNAPQIMRSLIKLGSVVTLLVSAAAAAATLYRYAPSRDKAKWLWLSPGTALSALGWLLLSVAFGFYVSRIANYNATYGSLGAVVALLTWVYLASYIFLFGAELNSELEHQTAKDKTQGTAEPLGQRGAWSADHVAEDETGAADPAIADEQPESGTNRLLTASATSFAGRTIGLRKVGLATSILSTLGLSLLRKRGRAAIGASLLVCAASLSLLSREPKQDD
ncbi:MAG: YihY/virulence factor BrkB family protein [Sphingomonas bacterium]|nr:YihY/virulence factor BrkB family protein [Sphingomonas bacterium]